MRWWQQTSSETAWPPSPAIPHLEVSLRVGHHLRRASGGRYTAHFRHGANICVRQTEIGPNDVSHSHEGCVTAPVVQHAAGRPSQQCREQWQERRRRQQLHREQQRQLQRLPMLRQPKKWRILVQHSVLVMHRLPLRPQYSSQSSAAGLKYTAQRRTIARRPRAAQAGRRLERPARTVETRQQMPPPDVVRPASRGASPLILAVQRP